MVGLEEEPVLVIRIRAGAASPSELISAEGMMESVLETLSIYMKPIGIPAFGESLYRVSDVLEKICNQVTRTPISTIIAKSGVIAPGSLTGWTLPDALWLAACKRAPEISCYPMGEIAERAFKRTFVWLAIFSEGDEPASLEADLTILQKNIRNAIKLQKVNGVLAFFLTEYFYEMRRDSERRLKTYTKADPSYRYHFPDGKRPKSLAEERRDENILLEYCRKVADDCMPALLTSLAENGSGSLIEQLTNIYSKHMGRLPKGKKIKTSRKRPLNVVVGSKPWSELKRTFALDADIKRLLLHTKKANISYDETVVENFLAQIPGRKTVQLHSLSRDLLDVGVVVYIADQAVKRESTLKRRLDILMPVRHPKVWNEVKDLLAETVSFLGRDEVHFHFMKKKEKAETRRFKIEPGKRCVSLFSGGLDSAAGAVQILNDGFEPVFVSHHANSFTSGLQNRLMDVLNKSNKQPLKELKLYVNRSHSGLVSNPLTGFPKSLMTQFLRSFMFLSFAAVVAVESNMNKVLTFENGPIALNPMFSEARLNTRTAHPRFIASFQKLIEMLFKVKLEIENPFLKKTKGEVVSRFATPGFRSMVNKSNSCWNSFSVPPRAQRMKRKDYKRYHHDGDCLPCVIRRASLIHAELDHLDAPYLVDIFTEFPTLEMPVQVLIADYLRFCLKLKGMNDSELLLEHPDFSVCASGVDPKELVRMYKRHAREMIEGFHKFGSRETVQLVLPPLK